MPFFQPEIVWWDSRAGSENTCLSAFTELERFRPDSGNRSGHIQRSSCDSHGAVPTSQTELQQFGPVAGTSHWFETNDGYVEVVKRLPPLKETLYVPLEAVDRVDDGRVVVRSWLTRPPEQNRAGVD